MSNHYLIFREVIGSLTSEEILWIKTEMKGAHEGIQLNDHGNVLFEFKIEGEEFWIFSQEMGEPWSVSILVQNFLRQFRPQECFSLCWCNFSTSGSPGQCSGGGVFVTADSIEWYDDSYQWCVLKENEFHGGKGV